MGDVAENTAELDTDFEETINPDGSESNEDGDEGTQPEKKFTQEQVNSIISDRLSARKDKSAKSGNQEIERLKQENEVFRVAMAQSKDKELKEPSPDDYDDNEYDPEFIKKSKDYKSHVMQEEVKRQVSQAVTNEREVSSQNETARLLEDNQRKHYERVKKRDVNEYIKREDVAIDIFGQENINHFINTFDNSEDILFYLGTTANRAESERIAGLFKTNPILGISEIGGIRKTLKIEPDINDAPEPDSNIKGMPSSKKQRGPAGAKYT